ncbi:aminopeptidase [Thermotoga sp. KOL6]|uniref:aminopeptidase n=1 Tax=Thermotoga sp. KOL6 TaxID=126741 RepID=UPI000C76E0F1|nr:aminopeptidase [Thermotoga sp. KOL6]PLV59102.1 aminopeptidase [Thermotoga sp. KOL6]
MKAEKRNVWHYRERGEIESFSKDYIAFIGRAKTERLVVKEVKDLLENAGFVPLGDFVGDPMNMTVYVVNRGKAIAAFKVVDDLRKGLNMVVAHIDSPRLDFKPNPLVEDEQIALFKTHYYGGIKKYQWFSIPLEIHGVLFKSDGSEVEIHIGDKPDDPVFTIPDLLPHLDKEDAKISEKFKGENLMLIAGTIPLNEEEKEAVKTNVLKILNEMYGITEEDFVSAEIEVVPAFPPKEVGVDRSLIGAYGQDDRICAYTALRALLDSQPEKSVGVVLFDKEEIGSDGNTGAKARFYLRVLRQILKMQGAKDSEFALDEVLERTSVISGDVCAAVNPPYKDVHDLQNAPRVGYGVALVKYTGARGKYSTNDAHAEFVGRVRKVLNERNVIWQVATLGKVDQGGGGTIAKFFAERGADVVDMGPALLGMHSPFELSSKADLFETYKAYKYLLEDL